MMCPWDFDYAAAACVAIFMEAMGFGLFTGILLIDQVCDARKYIVNVSC